MISLCVVTRNEERRIEACVRDARPHADEVVVVDQSSDDGTAAILAKLQLGGFIDKCARDANHGYCEASRKMAHDMSSGDWILVLDADERLSAELKKALPHLVTASIGGYKLSRWTYVDGKVIDAGDLQYRLFRREAVRYLSEVHTAPQPTGKVRVWGDGVRQIAIVHEKSMSEALDDQRRYDRMLRGKPGSKSLLAMNRQLNSLR